MLKYIVRRILIMIPVLLGVILLVFCLMELAPGDAVTMMLGESPTAEDEAALRAELGLNDPLLVRYARYVWDFVSEGSLGNSFQTSRPVLDACLERYPATLTLAGIGTFMIVLIGLPLGILSALKRYSIVDTACTTFALIGSSTPRFWLGLLLILFFSLRLGWFPASGFDTPAHYVLPALTTGLGICASFMRTTRSSMLDVMQQDYVRTARAKGQTEFKVVTHHMLRNALLPIITVIGADFGAMLGGAMVTETVFSIPGLATFIIANIKARDNPVVLGGIVLIAITCSLLNLLVDLLYAVVDPRIRY